MTLRVRRIFAVFAAAALFGAAPLSAARAQNPPAAAPPNVGPIVGTVVDRQGVPIAGARVSLSQGTSLPASVLADRRGRFVFANARAGAASLSAAAIGFAAQGGIVVTDRQRPITVSLAVGGVIAGVITDENGDAVPGVQVQIFREMFSRYGRTQQLAGSARTDGLGRYRVTSLVTGKYIVGVLSQAVTADRKALEAVATMGSAAGFAAELSSMLMSVPEDASFMPSALAVGATSTDPAAIVSIGADLDEAAPAADGRRRHYQSTFYGGASPMSISVVEGQSAAASFALNASVVASLVGRVAMVDGAQVDNALISVEPASLPSDLAQIVAAKAIAGSLGAFVLNNVPPGAYVLRARTSSTTDPKWSVSQVFVDESATTTTEVSLRRGVAVRGSVDPHGGPKLMRVILTPAAGGLALTAAVAANDTFAFETAIEPGAYILSVAAGTQAKSTLRVTTNGSSSYSRLIDVTDTDVDLRISTESPLTVVSGRVTGPPRRSETGHRSVVVFSADRRLWQGADTFARSAPVSSDGAYSIDDVAPGEYLAAVVDGVDDGQLLNPALWPVLVGTAVTFTSRAGEPAFVNLVIR